MIMHDTPSERSPEREMFETVLRLLLVRGDFCFSPRRLRDVLQPRPRKRREAFPSHYSPGSSKSSWPVVMSSDPKNLPAVSFAPKSLLALLAHHDHPSTSTTAWTNRQPPCSLAEESFAGSLY